MSTIDERVVEMQFKNAGFISGVLKTVGVLQKLKDSLNLKGAQNSLNELDQAGKKFSLEGIGRAVDAISSKFNAMHIVAATVISNITNRALNAGIAIAKSLTIQPVIDGLSNYETKINAIQTILANTQAQGTTLSQVTAALQELNDYANKTVFNFADMTKNIGTFTAAGVDLQTSVSSIKGIANLAALSGSSSEQASGAMYQLSQAIAAGKVNLQDWNSVVNAGFGGKVFQNALIQTAAVHDKTVTAMIKKEGGFRNSLQKGWLTSKVLTETLNKFTGDLSNSQLKAMGYSEAEIKAIQKQAKAAVESATNIRTVTQLMQALHEEVGTAWANVWQALIGNITDATTTLSKVHTILENLFTTPVNDFAEFLQQWSDMGGRDIIIRAISNAFHALGAILKPVGQAFKDVFPPKTAFDFLIFTEKILFFTDKLKVSKQAAENIRKTFDGLFSLLKIGADVIGAVGKGVVAMFSGASGAAGSILGLTGNLGHFITHIKDVIESGDGLTKFFVSLGKILGTPINALSNLTNVFGFLGSAISKAYSRIQPFLSEAGNEFKNLGSAIASSIQSGGFANVESVINQGLFGLVLLSIRKFINGLGKSSGKETKGLIATIKESFEGLTGALQNMQATLKSAQLRNIAVAVGILAASILALSFVNVANLTKSLTAMTVMFTELVTALAIVTKISGSAGIIKLPIVAASLILLSTAIVILSGAVAILSRFSWESLAKGLGAIAILLTELVGAVALLSKNTLGVYSSALAMEAMAVAMNIMASAVGKLGGMDWKTLSKGIGSVAVLLLVIAGFNAISGGGAGLVKTAVSMVIISGALIVLSQAVQIFGAIPMGNLAKGLVGIAAALLIMAGGMILMTGTLAGSAALLVASAALVILANALTTLAGLSWAELAIALVALAGSLVLISAALIVINGALPGATALIVVAGALAIIAPVLALLGALSWVAIAKGLVALAGAFAIIGAAGVLLAAAVPGLLGLGAAVALIGVGVLAAGVGVAAFGAGIVILAAGITALGIALTAFVSSILGILPQLPRTFGAVITSFANAIGTAAPAIISALTRLLVSLLNAITKITPSLVRAFESILNGVLQILTKDAPRIVGSLVQMLTSMLNAMAARAGSFVTAGVNLIVAVLNGIARNVGRVVAAATNIVITFINTIGAGGLRITQAGVNMIIRFVNGLAGQINANTGRMRSAGINLAFAIINGMTGGLLSGMGSVISSAVSVASSALNAAKHFLHINSPSKRFHDEVGVPSGQGIETGLLDTVPRVSSAAEVVGSTALESMRKSLSGVNGIINSSIDVQPKITPVLDLTQARAGFSTLSGMAKGQLLTVDTSFVKATSISADNATAASAIGSGSANGAALTFNQYNTSPKALSSAEIYRQTKNQLSVVKGALPSLCSPR